MVNINATTPQLQLVKKWMEGYHSLNMDNVEPYVSKNFKYQACFHTADEAKGEHSERYGKVLGSMTNLEVRAQYENCFQARRLIAPYYPWADVHEVIEAPGKVVVHVRSSTILCYRIVLRRDT